MLVLSKTINNDIYNTALLLLKPPAANKEMRLVIRVADLVLCVHLWH